MSGSPPNHDREARLTNRSAWLSLTAALFFFVGLLTCGTVVQKTEDFAARAASGAPFGVALGGAMWARVTRAKLRALRRDLGTEQAPGGSAFADADEPKKRGEGSNAGSTPPKHS